MQDSYLPHGKCALIALAVFLLAGFGAVGQAPPAVIHFDDGDLQAVIDAAPPYSTILCNRNKRITIDATVVIRKALTLRGLNARLPAKLGKTAILAVEAAGVTITDFELYGNGDSVSQDDRSPLMVVGADDFRIENGRFENSSKDGVMISVTDKGGDITGGVVRNVVGRRVVRDTVSIGGGGSAGYRARNILVENIRAYDSELRGAVEVSDGADNITVRKVYAESCVYAIDVQDHGEKKQVNTNITIEDVYALDCDTAIRMANHEHGHANITIRGVTAVNCRKGSRWRPIDARNTANLLLENIRVYGNPTGPAVLVRNCDGVVLRDIVIEKSLHAGAAVLVEDCNDVLIDGVTVRGEEAGPVVYRVKSDEAFVNLRIRGVSASGILLENTSKKGALAGRVLSGNLAPVSDAIRQVIVW